MKRTTRRGALALAAAALPIGGVFAVEKALEWKEPVTTVARDASAAEYFAALGTAPQDDERAAGLPVRGTEVAGPKTPGTFRIVVVGESTALGFPFGLDLSLGTFLAAGLSRAHGAAFERFHVGESGRSSQGVLRFLDDALAMQPDLVVLYSGHNELLHRLTQPSPFGRGSFPWRLWPRIAERLERWHEASREPAPASRPARIPEDQWGAVGLALRTLAGGDREKNVWSSLPVTDRERELHLERWRTNLGAIVARIRDRKVPLVAIRPTSNLRVPPLSAGRGFDERALRAYEDGDFVRARDLDPAPVRMTSAHGAAFDETLRAAGVPVVDGDDCAREACATEVLGEQCFVDLMHPRERVYARFAEKVADRMGELGLPGLDAKGRARFREAAEEILARNAAVVAQGEVDSANLLVLLYLTYGNRAAAEQCGRAFPEERRDLRLTLAFDLALRFGGKIREADATLDRAVVRHAEWSDAIGWWRARAGAASEAP